MPVFTHTYFYVDTYMGVQWLRETMHECFLFGDTLLPTIR